MKTRLFLLCLLLPPMLNAQSVADVFYYAHKERKASLSLSVGNLLLTAGSWFIEDPDARKLARKSKRANILFSDKKNFVSQREIRYFIQDLKLEGFESLARVRTEGTNFEIFLREDKKGYVTNIVAILNEPAEFGMISLDCKFRLDDLHCLHDEVLSFSEGIRKNHRMDIDF